MKSRSESPDRWCYGIDVADDGTLVVAERLNRTPVTTVRYPAGEDGVSALRERIGRATARPSVCIRSCGAAALAIAMGLAALPVSEVTLVAPRAIEVAARASRETEPASPEDRAQRLARLAERLY
jgi:hypothetical protein